MSESDARIVYHYNIKENIMYEYMYPICTILYKTDNTDGWYYAIMSGSEKECKNECEKLKAQHHWYDNKCYVSSWCVKEQNIPFQNYKPSAEYIYRCTDLIYNPFNNKFYYSSEDIPYPESNKRTTNNFDIVVKGEGENDENIWEPDDVDDFESGTDVTISFGHKKDKIITIAEYILKDIPKFIKRLQSTGYANFSNEEYTYTKFLAWEVQDKVRFIVQYYGDDNIETEIDKLISKAIFYREFEIFNAKLHNYVKKHNKLYDEFKLQEEFLQGLKWKFDVTTVDKPIEYVYLKEINTKKKNFKLFRNNIQKKSKEHTVNFNTKEKLYCYRANDYYYWCDENRIIRRLFYTHKEEDIIRFMHSKDFVYKKGMSLTEIQDQLLARGYHQAIDCKYKNKKVFIYANGQVESKEATKEEQTELEQIIKQITKTLKDKNNLMVSEFVELLRTNIDCISYRDNKMKL